MPTFFTFSRVNESGTTLLFFQLWSSAGKYQRRSRDQPDAYEKVWPQKVVSYEEMSGRKVFAIKRDHMKELVVIVILNLTRLI